MSIPTARQLDWQTDEIRLFLHVGVNTFYRPPVGHRRRGSGDLRPDEPRADSAIRAASSCQAITVARAEVARYVETDGPAFRPNGLCAPFAQPSASESSHPLVCVIRVIRVTGPSVGRSFSSAMTSGIVSTALTETRHRLTRFDSRGPDETAGSPGSVGHRKHVLSV